MSIRIKKHAIIEFFTHENVSPTEIYNRLRHFYIEVTIDNNVRHWVQKIRDSDDTLAINNQSKSGQPKTATDEFHKQKVEQLIKENRRITQSLLSMKLGIGIARVNYIESELKFKKVCARWISRFLINKMMRARLEVCQRFLQRYKKEENNFL